MEYSTTYTTATQNPFKAFRSLISALQSGYDAVILRRENDAKLSFPIKITHDYKDIDSFVSTGSYFTNNWEKVKKQIEESDLHPIIKDLKLNYTTAFGSEEEYKNYLKTGKVYFTGMGKCFFIKYKDLIETRKEENLALNEKTRFVLTIVPKTGKYYEIKKLKRKVFVIGIKSTENFNLPIWFKIYRVLVYPFRLIPSKSILNMPEYKKITYRIGGVVNGFTLDLHIPKKFSFK